MGDAEQMWITVVPPLEDGGDDEAELVLIGIDPTSGDPGQQLVDVLLDRGHEGEEGVFYLLPFDLGVRYERDGDRLAVVLLTSPEVYDHMISQYRQDLAEAGAPLRDAPLVEDGVVLLRREIATDFDPATGTGDQPVVLLLQDGPAAEAELFSAFDAGEAALAVVGTWGEDE
ncbi:hypothetical protein [Saccharothrix syringae]|uniref:Uncharacterized protein n=1 Tax=Saccharothrix syringae TaxID=103733 RepID=A0A5Q0H0S3_SACSY|nr:hypothetical protein [Saccharothrix syringae]QFZ19779.1 hypothetical protein EKG83_22180 [Saccharothrix syringae]